MSADGPPAGESGTPTMLAGYRHQPGNHCGSTALRNLLAFDGIEISEEMALGLGAGACFYYFPLAGSPSRFINGRTARLEESFRELTALPLRLETFSDPQAAWAAARALIEAGRPALLLTDLYYLDHYGRSAHFPGHAVVLAGYDDELAYLSDTGFEELQATTLAHLAEARHAQHPAYPLAGHMLSLEAGAEPEAAAGGRVPDPTAAAPRAIAAAAARMLEPPLGEFEGLPALRRFAAELGNWPAELEDWRWCARFAYQVIERRGTGGGNFRLMYSRFLAEAGAEGLAEVGEGSELAAEAARRWTALAKAFREASEAEGSGGAATADAEAWQRVEQDAGAVLTAEERLWHALAELTG